MLSRLAMEVTLAGVIQGMLLMAISLVVAEEGLMPAACWAGLDGAPCSSSFFKILPLSFAGCWSADLQGKSFQQLPWD